jgi:hypothetical protein
MYRFLFVTAFLLIFTGIPGWQQMPQPVYAQDASQPPTLFMHQGNDSNCDYIAVANGVHAIGGNGEQAYWKSRELVPQLPRDFHEVYYTLAGPDGSDQPFTPDNLGAAPEAFIGVYEAMGYNAVFLSSTPGEVDLDFVRAIRDRLVANPQGTFVHLWTVGGSYNPQARVFEVAETGEQVSFPYPYHEVAAVAGTDPHHLMFLDGLAAQPYALRLEDVAYQLRAFNRAIVVSRNDGSLQDHQRFQISQAGLPYVESVLGGLYLMKARQSWGANYQQWGEVIAPPLRTSDGVDAQVVVPGEYVLYERGGSGPVTLALLGRSLADALVQAGVLSADLLSDAGEEPLTGGIRQWVEGQFGSVEQFEVVFGKTLTAEFGMSREQMAEVIPPSVWQPTPPFVIGVLTERALLVWDEQNGVSLVPLGRLSFNHIRAQLARASSDLPENEVSVPAERPYPIPPALRKQLPRDLIPDWVPLP